MPQELEDPDVVFAELKAVATELVRQIKDDQFDDAVLRLVSRMLDLRSATQNALLAKIKQTLVPEPTL